MLVEASSSIEATEIEKKMRKLSLNTYLVCIVVFTKKK